MMKKFMIAASIVALSAATAFSQEDGQELHRDTSDMQMVFISNDGEAASSEGKQVRRIFISRDSLDDDETLTINGQEIEIRDGVVFIDGDEIEASDENVFIINDHEELNFRSDDGSRHIVRRMRMGGEHGDHASHMSEGHRDNHHGNHHVEIDIDEVRGEAMQSLHAAMAQLENNSEWDVLSDEEKAEVRAEIDQAREEIHAAMADMNVEMHVVRGMRGEQGEAMHMHALNMARMGEDMANMRVEIDIDGTHDEAMAALEGALAGLEDGSYHSEGWDEMSEEEREEVREELREAREELRDGMLEMREGMREMREGMREMDRESAHERRVIMIERRAEMHEHADEMREAAREMREVEREMRHVEREEGHEGHRRVMRLHRDSSGNHDMVSSESAEERVRMEEDTQGRRRIWVNGEEQTGDDLTNWLNQIEIDRLAGGN